MSNSSVPPAPLAAPSTKYPLLIRDLVQAHGYERVNETCLIVLKFPALWITYGSERSKVAESLNAAK